MNLCSALFEPQVYVVADTAIFWVDAAAALPSSKGYSFTSYPKRHVVYRALPERRKPMCFLCQQGISPKDVLQYMWRVPFVAPGDRQDTCLSHMGSLCQTPILI